MLSDNYSHPMEWNYIMEQHGGHFAEAILRCIFVKENSRILIKISQEFVCKVLIDN